MILTKLRDSSEHCESLAPGYGKSWGEKKDKRRRGGGELYKVSDRQPSTERLKAGDYEPEPVSWILRLGRGFYLMCRYDLVRDGEKKNQPLP